jgi:A/G-specific adenine glycosylase
MSIKADLLLNWYQKSQRALPWRPQTPNPYYTLLSEFLLQQTQVSTVLPYFERFIAKWPTLEALAKASLDDILKIWQGLGYYSRARNLHKCVNTILNEYNGIIPSSEIDLLTLPGIGPYTAAAISAIAFDLPSVVIDGNIARIMSRLYALSTPLKRNMKEIRELASQNIPFKKNGDYSQALMDLGATICKPTIAHCKQCPLQTQCEGFLLGSPLSFPEKEPKNLKPTYYSGGYIFIQNNTILLRKRAHNKMLHGLWEIPCDDWEKNKSTSPILNDSDFRVEHVFSHFKLISDIKITNIIPQNTLHGTEQWIEYSKLSDTPLSSLTKKLIQKAFSL